MYKDLHYQVKDLTQVLTELVICTKRIFCSKPPVDSLMRINGPFKILSFNMTLWSLKKILQTCQTCSDSA